MNKYIVFSPQVEDALKNDIPIVGLESSLISHGMPYPHNYETALAMEEIVKSAGVVPATIALMDGKIKVGLEKEEIRLLATTSDSIKVTTKDLSSCLREKKIGGTTVASSMKICTLSGIKVFSTGGIGGVHRGVESTLDISADLVELTRSRVAVVCSGCKSILDIPKTLEYLETMGVQIIGYRTKKFPSFFSEDSEEKLSYSCETTKEIAELIMINNEINYTGGIIVANPVPAKFSVDNEYIEMIIQDTLKDLEQQNIKGKEVTPFILSGIVEKTKGESLLSNIELAKNNAAVAAQIAKDLKSLI